MKMVFVSGGNGKEDAPSQGGCGGNGKDPTIVYYDATVKTNTDRIRSMTDEELAEFLDDVRDGWSSYYPHFVEDWLDWLKQETKE